MAMNSKIQWCDHTWNPWYGCTKISPGCKNCYMFREVKRFGNDPAVVRRASKRTFDAPLSWPREKARVFTCSWGDFWSPEADDWRMDALDIIAATPHLTYLILTKRPTRIVPWLESTARAAADLFYYLDNVWLGVSVESQDYAGRIHDLAAIPARFHFASYEPALGALNIDFELRHRLVDWVIAGGESGPGCREANINWFRSIRNQCLIHNVPFFLKQLGGTARINGAYGGCHLDGYTWGQYPDNPEFALPHPPKSKKEPKQ